MSGDAIHSGGAEEASGRGPSASTPAGSDGGDVAATQNDRPAIPSHVHCPVCGYDLRGTTSERCNECGCPLAGLRRAESGIPWVHRQERGRFRAFWATVYLVLFKHRQFCEEYARTVDYRDAQRFRLVVLAYAWGAVVVGVAVVYPALIEVTTAPSGQDEWLVQLAIQDVWPAALLAGCFLLFLLAATGAPSYFFHPPALPVVRQNSAVAMSYYTCAPLAAMPVPVVFGCLAIGVLANTSVVRGGGADVFILAAIAGLTLAGVFVWWWRTLVKTARRIMPQLPRRWVSMAIAVPLLWVALAGLTLIVIPLVISWVLIVFASLA